MAGRRSAGKFFRKFITAGLVGLVVVCLIVFFTVRYQNAYPYISFSYFSTTKQFLAFHKNVFGSYFYDWKNGVERPQTVAPVAFDSIDVNHSRAAEFRRRFRLDYIAKIAPSKFGQIILLRRWVHSKVWPITLNQPKTRLEVKDAFALMEAIGKGVSMNPNDATVLFAQAAGVMGFTARQTIGFGHPMADVWSPDHEKWVVMDPFYDTHYEKNGVPLNSVELKNIFFPNPTGDDRDADRSLGVSFDEVSGKGTRLLGIFLQAYKDVYARFGVQLRGGPAVLPKKISGYAYFDMPKGARRELFYVLSAMRPRKFKGFGISLRNDYLIFQYPKTHLRYHNHVWNYLFWSGSVKSQPQNAYQVSGDLKDFYWVPSR